MSGSFFLAMHCVRRQSTNKEGVKNSFPHQHFDIPTPRCYAIRLWCSSVVYRASLTFNPLGVWSISAEGTLPHLTQTSRSPQIPAKLRSLCSRMVCYWLGLTFCYLPMQIKRWQILSNITSYHIDHHLLSGGPVSCFIVLKYNIHQAWAFQNKKTYHQPYSQWAPTTGIHFMP